MVILPKKYLQFGFMTVSAPRPSHRLSRAKMDFVFFLTFWYSSETNDRPNSTVYGAYSLRNLSEKWNMWLVASMGWPLLSYFHSLPKRYLYPPIISSSSGFHTMSWRHGSSMVSNSSMSMLFPVPPPAVRKAISRNRPISFITFGALCAVTTYISLWLLLVVRSRRSFVSSPFRMSLGMGWMISSSMCLFCCWVQGDGW